MKRPRDPGGDLFTSIRSGRADVVTNTIETFTETGIELGSGKHLDADIIVLATGLQVQMLSGAVLEVDLTAEYVCRLLTHMDEHGYNRFDVHATDADRADGSVLDSLSAGYVQRGNASLPRQGTHGPWKVRNDYLRGAPMLRHAPVDDGVIRFSTARRCAC